MEEIILSSMNKICCTANLLVATRRQMIKMSCRTEGRGDKGSENSAATKFDHDSFRLFNPKTYPKSGKFASCISHFPPHQGITALHGLTLTLSAN